MELTSPLLLLKRVTAGYNGTAIIHEVDMAVNPAEVVLITGPNGAGKSTLLKVIFGFLKQSAGYIYYGNKTLNGYPPYLRVLMGMSYVFQDRKIFARLTVEENLRVAFKGNRRAFQDMSDIVYERFSNLHEKRKTYAGRLSGGEQQMLAIGRVLMQAPKIILFDEPTAGLSPEICERVFLGIKSLTDRGIASVMVEHRISEALAISDRCLQMKDGRVSSLWRSNKFGSLTTISFAQRRGSDEKER